MIGFFTAFMNEAKGQPLATFLVLLVVGFAIYWIIVQFPKVKKDRQELSSHVATSNELLRHSSAVIENNSKVIENNTRVHEMTEQSLKHLCDDVGNLHDRMETHDQNAISVLNKQTEILTILRK